MSLKQKLDAYEKLMRLDKPIGTLLLLKIPLVVVLASYGPTGIWVSIPVGEALAASVALVLMARLSAGRPPTPGDYRRTRSDR